jgi:outer membrane protein assembly factor BamB
MRKENRLAWALAALAATTLILTAPLGAGPPSRDWPQFRGIERDGVSLETGLLAEWPEGGPKIVWRQPLGEGYSGIAVVGDRLYTMFAVDHEGEPTEVAAAFDAGTGKEIWRTPIGKKHDTEFGNGPRSTPTVDGGSVYVLGSFGDLAALSAESGSEHWRLNLPEKFDSEVPHWGFSASVLVDGGQLIIEGGGAEGKSYAALDKKTGEVRWTIGDGRGQPGYNSAIAIEMGGKTRYVYVAGTKLTAVDPDGEEIWSRDWPEGETHASPVFVAPDRIFASGAEGVGAKMVRISDGGEAAEVADLWESRFMRNHFSSSVVLDGYIYGFDNATLRCISVEDGSTAWAKRGLGKGSLILADGHLFVLSDRGKLLLLEATPEGYVEKGSAQALEGRCWTSPTLSGGRLYLRNHTEMVALHVAG